MSDGSDIEWTDATWNPTRGCTKVSPGCKHCYAETFAERWRGIAGHPYELGFDPRLVPEQLDVPFHWKKPRTIFVNSMSDLFADFVPFEYIGAVFGVMAATPRHTYQILTKRAERLAEWSAWAVKQARYAGVDTDPADAMICMGIDRYGIAAARFARRCDIIAADSEWPLYNVHLGVSVEDRRYGLSRIDALRTVPSALRFLSIEPLLEDLGPLDLTGIGWVILGGESGAGARPLELRWFRSIVAQCREQKVPVFVKQLGAKPTHDMLIPAERLKLKSAKGKNMAEWPEDLRIREMPVRLAAA
jgi:protein gp37